MKLDQTDRKLVNMLQENSKRPIKELAQVLNLTIAPIHERIKKLEKSGVIRKYVALINPDLVDKSLISYCTVRVEKHKTEALINFEEQVRNMDEILECYSVSGNYDFLLKVITANMNTYQDFIMNKLSKLEMIANVNSQFVLKNVKFRTDIKV